MLPPALFDDDTGEPANGDRAEGLCTWQVGPILEETPLEEMPQQPPIVSSQLAVADSQRDPIGRDQEPNRRRRPLKGEWSVEPLAKYLKGVASQIDANLQNHGAPTSEKLDVFVERLVFVTQRQTRHAPKKIQQMVRSMFSQ